MELNRDYESYRRVFQAQSRVGVMSSSAHGSTIYLVESELDDEGERKVIACFSEQEDLTEWVGRSKREFRSAFQSRELVAITEENWVQALARPVASSWQEGHFLGQISEFRQNLKQTLFHKEATQGTPAIKKGARLLLRGLRSQGQKAKGERLIQESHLETQQNFVMEALSGWWLRILPSHFGLYVRVENEQNTQVLLTIKAGKVDQFYSPDLGAIHADRKAEFGTLVAALSEKTLMPIQGVRVTSEEWTQWMRSPNPWTLVSRSIRSGRTQLAPFRWFVALLIGTRAFLGL